MEIHKVSREATQPCTPNIISRKFFSQQLGKAMSTKEKDLEGGECGVKREEAEEA